MATIYTTAYVGEVDVEVELDDIDTDDLIEELERRGRSGEEAIDYLTKYEADYLWQIVDSAIKREDRPVNVILWQLERKLRNLT